MWWAPDSWAALVKVVEHDVVVVHVLARVVVSGQVRGGGGIYLLPRDLSRSSLSLRSSWSLSLRLLLPLLLLLPLWLEVEQGLLVLSSSSMGGVTKR